MTEQRRIRRQLVTYLDKPIMDKLKAQAKEENRTIGNMVETICIKYMKELDAKKE